MTEIIRKILVIFIVKCLLYNLSKIVNIENSTIPIFTSQVKARSFKNENINYAEIFYADVADDINTRLNQILNNDIQYYQQSSNLKYSLEKKEKELNYHRRNFISSFFHNEKINDKDISNESMNYTQYPSYSSEYNSTDLSDKSSNHNRSTSSSSCKIPNDNDNTDRYKLSKNCKNHHRENNGRPLSEFYHGIDVDEDDLLNLKSDDEMDDVPFNFIVECMDDEEKCIYINDKLENAGHYISNIFNIYQTINVDVHILPFCKSMNSDNCADITALTYSPSFITLNITDQGYYSYPQALVKQFDFNNITIDYSSYDMSLYFNTDYLRKGNYGNYLIVATHEIIHGMGFFHLMTTASAAFKMTFPEDRIIPQPLANNYRTRAGNEKSYKGWIPFTVFDRYVVEMEHPDYYIHQGIQEYLEDVKVHKFTSEENVIHHFENLEILSNNTHAYSKHLVKPFTTREAIGFKAYDGEVITLQTFKEYEPMSSISHIHAPFACDSSIDCFIPKEKLNEVDDNYLMYYTIITRSVNELVERFSSESSHGFVGSKVIKILKTIGWTEREQDEFYYKSVEQDILSKEARSSSISSISLYSFYNNIIIINTMIIVIAFIL
ncbi:hypothetical protein BCR36DRAFT_583548 [Piromyces finnis]|uniref:Uncharacterized protein n=1 Tax=Piromyces finnis TaxID=1754191 RepID=A0A1Y1VA94_9FUNG|nr:hypothetical protein BCR36DRAFT_583548 [Piromyces finnis]|eukprot:ORX50423.1 hypothetical protein BCR36DRAFT_583548 [Piromyces finnis]